MPKLIKLNSFGTLAITIPKSICESLNLKAGDDVKIEIKSTSPVILGFQKLEPIKW
jgi:AbrB family looped-hinge helix DNA binding protein